jgi:hypothetical protein
VAVIVAGLLGDWAVRGPNALLPSRFQPSVTHPAPSDWTIYGSTTLTTSAPGQMHLTPAGFGAKWYGASLPGPSFCDYRLEFDALLSPPLYGTEAEHISQGYAVAVRGEVQDGVPHGRSIQYDHALRGLVPTDLPEMVEAENRETIPWPTEVSHFHHWLIDVTGASARFTVDGAFNRPVALPTSCGGAVVLRIWNSTVDVRNVVFKKR